MFSVASFKEDTPLKSRCKCQGVLKIPLFNFRFISKEPVDYAAHQSTHTPNRKTFGECVEVAQKDYQVSKGYYPKQRDCRCWRGCRVRAEGWDSQRTSAGSWKALCREGQEILLCSLQKGQQRGAGQPGRFSWAGGPMAAAGTGLCPHAGGAGTGQRRQPPAESVPSKPQSSPTVLLVLLVPFLPQACFLSPQRHCVALRR